MIEERFNVWYVLWACKLAFMLGQLHSAYGAEVGPYVPTLAAAGGMATIAKPAPLPAPDPGNICPECNGKGWNGDGTIRNKCEPCNGTGKRTTMAADLNTPAEQPEAEVISAGANWEPAAVSSEPKVAAVKESQPVADGKTPPLPPVFTDYIEAMEESTRTREILVLLHPNFAPERLAKSREAMIDLPEAHRFTWLILPADSSINGQTAREFFNADRDFRLVRHNTTTGANRLVESPQDLEN